MKTIPWAVAVTAALMCGSVVQAQYQSPSQSSGATGATSTTDSGVGATTGPREANVNAGGSPGSPGAMGTSSGNHDPSMASGGSDSSRMGMGRSKMMAGSMSDSTLITSDGVYPSATPGSLHDPSMQ
ncbi:MAG: hypothetical protein ABIQ90_00535 [Polaromonas sp.]